jgi:hypothetical protein
MSWKDDFFIYDVPLVTRDCDGIIPDPTKPPRSRRERREPRSLASGDAAETTTRGTQDILKTIVKNFYRTRQLFREESYKSEGSNVELD